MGVMKVLKTVLRIVLLPLFIIGLFNSKSRFKCWRIIQKDSKFYLLIFIALSLILDIMELNTFLFLILLLITIYIIQYILKRKIRKEEKEKLPAKKIELTKEKSNKFFTWLGIDDETKEDKSHRRDFWIVLIIICLIVLPLVYTQWSKYFLDKDIDVSKIIVISPTAMIMDTIEECSKEMDKGQICFVENELNKEDKQFIEQKNNKYWNLFLVKQKKVNSLDDPSFEKGLWPNEAGDCCNGESGEAEITVDYINDSSDGNLALQLSSRNHCACVSKVINTFDFDKTYILTFDYKGDNPKYCLFVDTDHLCMPKKSFLNVDSWKKEIQILTFTNKSVVAYLYFYTDAFLDKPKINKYDNIQIYELVETLFSPTIKFDENKINIKTDYSYFAKIKSKYINYQIESNNIKKFNEQAGHFKKDNNIIKIKQQYKKQFFIYGILLILFILVLLLSIFNLIKVK